MEYPRIAILVIHIDPKTALNISRFIVFLGFITALIYQRVDHIYRTLVALIGLYIPDVVERYFSNPHPRLRQFLAPIYNKKTMALLGVFIAVHVSLVNVPFTTIDLFHKEWRNADMISHFIGGMVVWAIIAEVLLNLSDGEYLRLTRRKLVLYSFLALFILSFGWEVAEKLSESEISFIHEDAGNKLRDIIMNTFGGLFAMYLVLKRRYPFEVDLNH
ncbi:hypothetical protein OCC_08754 [Thermococcus litoralis DSM 5473]|jgi:hypothetical protein|uniref:Uncharacterized protein n=1 Tax=Thermococcus litoralis (strain ATCC 51850 / DSM 5473 / JCM 8560 / NS-C) TaxID=523849 RepID=H3ZK77_THELN|nr:hypothetical protein OCC_08754 [Thermococcus litoralis DSM 5473]